MSRLGLWPGLALSVGAGALVALQSRYNGELGSELGSSYVAALISCCVGIGVLLVLTLSSRRATAGLGAAVTMLRRRGVPLWALSGGFAGAFLVLAQSAAVRSLGASLFAVGSVAGQTLTGLVLDRFGLGTGTRVPIRPLRALGAALAVVAVLVAGLGVHAVASVSWLVILPLLAGAGTGWQAAVNGRLRQATGSTLIATLLNFSVGLAALILTAVVAVLLTGMPTTWPANPLAYLGGAAGVAYVLLVTFVVRATGVLLLGLSTVAGQLLASVVLDAFLPLGPRPDASVLIGILLSLAAVVVAATPGHGVTAASRPRLPRPR
ncbi:DMT family transporter [Microbacterium sp. Bi121]|uniref:DMT family transporter n=1 Tax=Microbacterium sp. Bi121 TaxID=2822348 RepID=UPI001D9B2661|nr:DMT family transporter [Microbacterium sp. Bi121]CAH0145263.1 hypothetical protein SRABI121_01112 [Microbacterium sp. Bi121]